MAAEDRIAGDSHCCSCRVSWWRRTRSDEREDKHGLCSGAAGVRWRFGRRRPRRNPLPTPACRQGRGQRRSRAPERSWSRGRLVRGSAMQRGPGSGRVECGRVACRRSARAQSTHGTCSTKCQRALELEGGAGTAQDGGRGNKALSGQGGSVRGPSPQCKPESADARVTDSGRWGRRRSPAASSAAEGATVVK